MAEFFISDTHFGDNESGIILFEKRPFKDKRDMIDTLVSNWNSVVKYGDTVYHLGDVFWGLDYTERRDIVQSLNGTKILILGNHDRDQGITYWNNIGFEKVYDLPVILHDFWILSHEPLYMVDGPYCNIFGHVHGNKAYKDYSPVSFCACVERDTMQYKPISFEQLKAYVMSTR